MLLPILLLLATLSFLTPLSRRSRLCQIHRLQLVLPRALVPNSKPSSDFLIALGAGIVPFVSFASPSLSFMSLVSSYNTWTFFMTPSDSSSLLRELLAFLVQISLHFTAL